MPKAFHDPTFSVLRKVSITVENSSNSSATNFSLQHKFSLFCFISYLQQTVRTPSINPGRFDRREVPQCNLISTKDGLSATIKTWTYHSNCLVSSRDTAMWHHWHHEYILPIPHSSLSLTIKRHRNVILLYLWCHEYILTIPHSNLSSVSRDSAVRHHYDTNKYELYLTATSPPLGDTTISSMYTSHCIHIKMQWKLFAFLTPDTVQRTTTHCFLFVNPKRHR